jgi:hypothetical protein
MATTNGNRKILDLKRWEFCSPSPVTTGAGVFVASSRHARQQQLLVTSNTAQYIYNPNEDGFVQIPSGALASAVGAGASGTAAAFSLGAAIGSTTIAAGSNNAALPQATINVASTTGFPLAGAFYVDTADRGRQLITYASVPSGTQFGGCSGGAGTLLTSQVVSLAGLVALSGTTSTIVTNQLLARDLRGYSLHVMSGPNAGATLEIQGNTTAAGQTTVAAGSNGVALPTGTINVASTAGFTRSGQILVTISGAQVLVSYTGITATSFTGCTGGTGTLATSQAVQFASTITLPTQASAFTTATVFRLITPAWYVVSASTLAAGSFRKYDFATNQWVSGTIVGFAGSLGTDGKLLSTPSWVNAGYKQFATGTATSGTNSTLVVTGKTWATNQWTNYQIRITAGTGAGQIRPIASNTADTITVSGWNTNPDSTSTYSIEGNDDFLYYAGNNAVTMYRYSIVSNSWTTLSPGVARGGAPGAGMSGHWIHSVSEADWNNESAIKNGRYLYSFRGAGGALLDRYDIAANTWEAVSYAPAVETLTTGTKYSYCKDRLYIAKEATGRWFAFDFAEQAMQPWSTMTYTQGAAVLGDTAFDVTYRDGATEIDYVYMILNTSTVMLRQMVI